ncbi:EamA family transporter [uncultured Paludibaculum sp.]|uniref:EamA family transporter n=1 Tax=uncultured Paludibaculum sp. TaxID=1765020 RepID=UPI002AAC405E|nr:EamA family transporter [uncultured Paludibaculum sp.]
MNTWLLVGGVVLSTVCADLLQSHGMRRGGAQWKVSLSFVFLATSFFSFTQLLLVADLSFAVPATAASIVIETLMAKLVLKENVDVRRWAGAALVAAGVALLSH